MHILIALGLVLVLGLAGGLVSRRLNLPSITGYVVVGLVIGPTVTGVIGFEEALALEPITAISLGVIAYLIGTSLQTGTLRSLGRSIPWITLLEALGAFFAVAIALALFSERIFPGFAFRETYLPFALLMGATSSATAPAAVLAIIREYRAKGPLTSTLLAVVALDDAVAVILFAVAMAVSLALVGTAVSGSALAMVAQPILQLGGSVLLGAAFAGGALLMANFVRAREMALVLVLGAVVLCYGTAEATGLSGIMACMILGFVVGNRRHSGDLIVAVEDVQAVLFTMFFVIAGLHFDTGTFATAAPLALIIVVVRIAGKYAGTRLGARIGGAAPQVGSFLGLALLPQAGVSIGLTLIAAASFPELAAPMVSATLASVIINELITPPLARKALVKAGEARFDSPKDEAHRGAAVTPAPVEPASVIAQPAVEQGSTNGHHVTSGPLAVGIGDSHLSESPWTRSQRSRDRASRNRRA